MWRARCGARRKATLTSRSGSRTPVPLVTGSAAGPGPHCRTLTSGLPWPVSTVREDLVAGRRRRGAGGDGGDRVGQGRGVDRPVGLVGSSGPRVFRRGRGRALV